MTKRQNQIVQSAIKLIADKGIQNLTIKHLANEIGITEPALYRHFKNKFEILNAVIDEFIGKIKPGLEKLDTYDNYITAIEEFIKIHFVIFQKNPELARIIFSESNFQNERLLLQKLNRLMESSQSKVENVISKGQSAKQIRSDIDKSSLFRIIIGPIRLLVTQWSLSEMRFDLKSEGDKLCKQIIKIIKS